MNLKRNIEKSGQDVTECVSVVSQNVRSIGRNLVLLLCKFEKFEKRPHIVLPEIWVFSNEIYHYFIEGSVL